MFFFRSGLGSPNALLNSEFAFSPSLLWNMKAEPCSWLVPDLVTTVLAAPPAMPRSASKLLDDDVDRLDRLGRRDVARVVRQPDVDRHRAVDAGGVAVRLDAVHPGPQRAARRVDLGVLELGGRRAGDEVDQLLVVAELVQREVDDRLRRQLGAEVGLLRLEQRRLADHVDGLGQRADLELQVHADGVAGGDAQARLVQRAEALEGGVQVVDAGRQVAEGVGPVGVGDRIDAEAGAGVRRRHGGAGNGGALLVRHGARDGAVEGLRGGRKRGEQRGDDRQRQRRFQREACERSHPGISLVIELGSWHARRLRDAAPGLTGSCCNAHAPRKGLTTEICVADKGVTRVRRPAAPPDRSKIPYRCKICIPTGTPLKASIGMARPRFRRSSSTSRTWFAGTCRSVWTLPLGHRISTSARVAPASPKCNRESLAEKMLPLVVASPTCVTPPSGPRRGIPARTGCSWFPGA